MPNKIKSSVFSRDNFICQKCNFRGTSENLEIHSLLMKSNENFKEIDNLITLCSICNHYAPDEEHKFKKYLQEKIDGRILNTFRVSRKSISNKTKKGMAEKSKKGETTSRAPFGYKIVNKKLVPGDNSHKVHEIFQNFLNTEISLTKLSKKNNLSVNGLKKILTNQTYLGKIKFDGQTYQGIHTPLISSTLFNHVQNKLEKLGIQKN